MSRLYDDPTKLGPGSYFPTNEVNKKSVVATTWSNYRSQRGNNEVKTTPDQVGPGSYNSLSTINRAIMNPTFARTNVHLKKNFSRNISGVTSIQADFGQDEEDDGKLSPGPG